VALPPAEIVLEDRKSVADFLEARLEAATRRPSRNVLHDLVVAVSVGHRRAQRALSLVFEGTEDAHLKRSILRRYSILDRSLEQVREALGEMPTPSFLNMTQSVVESIDSGFQFAFSHIDDVRAGQPEVDHTEVTRPAKPRDPEGTTTSAWFRPGQFPDGEGPTQPGAQLQRATTRRGH